MASLLFAVPVHPGRAASVLAPAGAVIGGVAVFAAPLGLDTSPLFGFKQWLLLAVGAALVLAGVFLRRRSAEALSLYWGLSLVLFGTDIGGDAGRFAVGEAQTADPTLFMWMLDWWPHAIGDGVNPFVTHALYAPDEFPLMWATSIPGPSLALAPLTLSAGPVVAYNALMLMAPALSAWAAWALCRHVTRGAWWPSLLGGYVFGFSAFMAAHMLGHANLVLLALIPVVALLIVRRAEGRPGRVRFVLGLGAVLALQYTVSTELYATTAIFTGIAFVVAWLSFAGARRRIAVTAGETLGAGVASLVLAAPFVFTTLSRSEARPSQSVEQYSADFANLLFPTPVTSFGGATFAELTGRYTGNIFESGAYIGFLLLLLMALGARGRAGRALLTFFLVVIVAALGPTLHVAGAATLGLPWRLVDSLPFVEYALPGRFVVFALLAAAVLAARATQPGGWPRWALAALAALTTLPAVEDTLYKRELVVPAYFKADRPAAGERVLMVPEGPGGDGMLYQAEAGFSFDQAGGYSGVQPPDHSLERYPILADLRYGRVSPGASEELRRFIADKGVTAILLDLRKGASYRPLLDSLGIEPVIDAGVARYDLR